MFGIVDYGMGNLGSVYNACRFLQLDAEILDSPSGMDRCKGMILPGQGAFRDCMRNLDQSGFTAAIKEWIAAGRPFFGICIGLQVLFEGSDEAPGVDGFGVLPGVLRKFQPGEGLKVPQMGWNRVRQRRPECPLYEGVPDASFFYFVHSYYVCDSDEDWAGGESEFGTNYISVAWRNNLHAVQFHPEKSQAVGLRMLRNFGSRL